MSFKNILVTGSSGTIGTRLCEKLLERGQKITCVDLRHNKWNEKINKITIIGDLRKKEVLEKLPKDVDLVIHLAANARVYNLVEKPELARDNIETTFNTLEFCRKNHIRKFVFASSREVYGNSKQTIHKENDAYVRNCESPYTASKIAGEALVHSYMQCYGINFIILRFSNVYGMYDDSDRVVPLFIRMTKENKDMTVYGKEKYLDFTYIDDAVTGVMKCIENFENTKNDTFNIASGHGFAITSLAELIKRNMNGKNNISVEDNRTGEVIRFVADVSKARNRLNFEARTSIDDGIRKSISWYIKNAKPV